VDRDIAARAVGAGLQIEARHARRPLQRRREAGVLADVQHLLERLEARQLEDDLHGPLRDLDRDRRVAGDAIQLRLLAGLRIPVDRRLLGRAVDLDLVLALDRWTRLRLRARAPGREPGDGGQSGQSQKRYDTNLTNVSEHARPRA